MGFKDWLEMGILGILVIALVIGVSFLVTCGIIKLICLCFAWTFSWKIATGIWLGMMILRSIFSSGN